MKQIAHVDMDAFSPPFVILSPCVPWGRRISAMPVTAFEILPFGYAQGKRPAAQNDKPGGAASA